MRANVDLRRRGFAHVVFAATIGLVVLAVAPFATKPFLPDSSSFAAAIFTLIIFAEILTAFLLAQRYIAESDPRLLALAATYLFTGLLFVARQLVAPGAFGDGSILPLKPVALSGMPGMAGLPVMPGMASVPGSPRMASLPGGLQASMWLWIIAHVVFPVGIALSVALRRGGRSDAGARLHQYRNMSCVVVLTSVAVAAVTVGLIRYASSIPIIHGEGRPALLANLVTLPIVVPLAYWRSRRSGGYDRWVLGALAASCADVVLTTLGARPYTVGWFGGRMLSVIAAGVLLVALVGEISKLYRNLAVVHERLSFQAAHDALTGALARRALLDWVEIVVAQAKHQGLPAVLAIVDLDHLKQINDRHGHLMGDRVLRQAAQRMRTGLRDRDVLGRYGGDEFVIVMPDTLYGDGEAIANRVLELIRTLPIDIGRDLLRVTVAIGITAVEPGDETVDQVVARADAALYEAKARGRDQVVGYPGGRAAGRRPAITQRAPENAAGPVRAESGNRAKHRAGVPVHVRSGQDVAGGEPRPRQRAEHR